MPYTRSQYEKVDLAMRHTLSSKSGAAARKNWRADSTTALAVFKIVKTPRAARVIRVVALERWPFQILYRCLISRGHVILKK